MNVEVKRLDHLGIVAGTIKDLGIIDLVNEMLGVDEEEKVSAGEAVAAMILNGLGFTTRPLMLTTQFFENKPVDLLINEHVKPEDLNRHKLGRVLDRVGKYGSEQLFQALALQACQRENVNLDFAYNDTTSHSLEGEYDAESDLQKVEIKRGYSKDRRPDLKQIVQELITTQDGGIPLITKTHSGNASDSVIFRERAKLLMTEFARSGSRCLGMDSKAYTKETAPVLNKIIYVTRVPASIKAEQEIITKSLAAPEAWKAGTDGYKFQEYESDCYGIENQRWVVVYSEQARGRAEKAVQKTVAKEKIRVDKEIARLKKQKFSCASDAQKYAIRLVSKFSYHHIAMGAIFSSTITTKKQQPEVIYRTEATATIDQKAIDTAIDQGGCFVLSSTLPADRASSEGVLGVYKGLDKNEKGFAFLKSPEFFTSSFYLKSTLRIDALLMIMVLALLVYSIAQRRLRLALKVADSTIPNQIKKPVQNPTLRWIFQIFEGVEIVIVRSIESISGLVHGLTELRRHILSFLSPSIQAMYKFST